jgi:hypothetical protein
MDDARFDTLTRSLTAARSRRATLATLLGGPLVLLGLADAAAKKRKKKTTKKRRPTQSAPASPSAGPCIPACAGNVCGNDGCGGTCGIACSSPRICEGGRCVCPRDQHDCQGTCIPRTRCCTATDCQPGQGCFTGTCINLRGTCAAGSNACTDHLSAACGGGSCACFTTMEGDTRCGAFTNTTACNTCTTDAQCAALLPNTPGAFCVQGGGIFCTSCAGYCAPPCPR